MSEFRVGLSQEGSGPHVDEAREAVVEALGGAPATQPDEAGTFEVTVSADSTDAALLAVWNAIAAAGADDHIFFIEHPDVPGHWRQVPR